MKILFVMPKMGAWATHGRHCAPNQFYAQLIAYIREKKLAECYAIDARVEDEGFNLTGRIKEISPDVVFLGEILHSTAGFAPIWHYTKLAQEIKSILPAAKIAVGGLWFSALFEDTLKRHAAIDFVIIGEAELTLAELLLALKEGADDFSSIAGLASRKKGSIAAGQHRELIKDLDILPAPAYDLFPMARYVGHTHWKPFCELLVSRGCPGGCIFCYEWSQYDPRFPRDFVSWRIKSAAKIVHELEVLNKQYGVGVVVFQDDAFNVSKDTVEQVCRAMIQRRIKMNWVILGRADDWIKQRDILALMKEAGMFMGLLGVEVASDEELKKIGKNISTHQIIQVIEALRKHDVMSIGTFMVGFEDDDEAGIKKRFEFADRADPDIFALQFFTPVPGSALWKKYIDKGWIDMDKLDLRDWDFQHPVIPTNHLSIEDVGRLGSWCMREFFSKAERVSRIFQGKYHELAVKCVTDFMENISSFERGATGKKSSLPEVEWDKAVEQKFAAAVSKMPFFYRGITQKLVRAKSESLAQQQNSGYVSEQELVNAFFEETPAAFKEAMKGVLNAAEIDYKKYRKEE